MSQIPAYRTAVASRRSTQLVDPAQAHDDAQLVTEEREELHRKIAELTMKPTPRRQRNRVRYRRNTPVVRLKGAKLSRPTFRRAANTGSVRFRRETEAVAQDNHRDVSLQQLMHWRREADLIAGSLRRRSCAQLPPRPRLQRPDIMDQMSPQLRSRDLRRGQQYSPSFQAGPQQPRYAANGGYYPRLR